MNFGQAIEAVKQGAKIARKGWNGKNMFVFLAENIEFTTKANLSSFLDKELEGNPALCMKTANDQFQVGWLASQTDMFAEDWHIVE